MKLPVSTSLIIAGGLFVLVTVGIIVMVLGIGKAYRREIREVENQPGPQKLTIFERERVKKVTIRKGNERGCMEITPDGAIRVYSVCGKTLKEATRLADPKNILKLFKLVTEEDLSSFQESGSGFVYEVFIETDKGTKTVYLVLEEEGSRVAQTIIDTIELIVGDLPPPSATTTLTPTQAPISGGATPPPTPTGAIFIPTPTPTTSVGGDQIQTFTCGFSESSGGRKPYNVSNIICSTEPTPAP